MQDQRISNQNKPITEKGQTTKVTKMYKMIVEMIYYFPGN